MCWRLATHCQLNLPTALGPQSVISDSAVSTTGSIGTTNWPIQRAALAEDPPRICRWILRGQTPFLSPLAPWCHALALQAGVAVPVTQIAAATPEHASHPRLHLLGLTTQQRQKRNHQHVRHSCHSKVMTWAK